jgi:hypothetical protein
VGPVKRTGVPRQRRSELDAELVAAGVLHDGEVAVGGDVRGAEGLEAGHLVGDGAGGAEVEVEAVLGGLGLRDTLEPQVDTAPAGRLDVRLLGRGVLVELAAEGGSPEPGDGQGVLAVDGDAAETRAPVSGRADVGD